LFISRIRKFLYLILLTSYHSVRKTGMQSYPVSYPEKGSFRINTAAEPMRIMLGPDDAV